jgi:enamine deaminase RidA (YjgF/YER057c/UK114 family)
MAAVHPRRRPARPDALAGIVPTPPTDQYVPVVRSGGRLFVAGHDPERDGRLAYRGRMGRSVSIEDTARALRLATQNALAAARASVGSLDRLRCVVLVGFVSSATSDGLTPALLEDSLALLAAVLPAGVPPVACLRSAQGLAGGMPVEVELVLEARRRAAREPRVLTDRARPLRKGGRAAARAPRRSAVRTS